MRLFSHFGERVLWQRVDTYLARYQPHVIGVAGGSGVALTQAALGVGLAHDSHPLRVGEGVVHSRGEVALSVLGLPADHKHNWLSLLSRSAVEELVHEEPELIITSLPLQRPGQLDWLSERLPLRVAVLTNADAGNLTYFGSKEMLAHELASLAVTRRGDTALVLNSDDALLAPLAEKTRAAVITYGRSDTATVHLRRADRRGRSGFVGEVVIDNHSYEVHLPHLVGRQQLSAVLATLAVAHALQHDIDEVLFNLRQFTPPPGCARLLPGVRGAEILDDAADATPESMLAALETLRALSAGRKIAILGDIPNLASTSAAAHRRIGKFAGEIARVVILVGEEMRTAGVEAIVIGADVHHFAESRDVGKWLADFLQDGDLVLVCGGAPMAMGEVVIRLTEPTR